MKTRKSRIRAKLPNKQQTAPASSLKRIERELHKEHRRATRETSAPVVTCNCNTPVCGLADWEHELQFEESEN